jgi:hypothetical protein
VNTRQTTSTEGKLDWDAENIKAVLNSESAVTPDIKGSYTIHYTQLPDKLPGEPLFYEWNTYRRELPRLLAEGHEGKYVLIKGQAILDIFATFNEVLDEGEERFPDEDFLAQKILEWQPVLRVRWAG